MVALIDRHQCVGSREGAKDENEWRIIVNGWLWHRPEKLLRPWPSCGKRDGRGRWRTRHLSGGEGQPVKAVAPCYWHRSLRSRISRWEETCSLPSPFTLRDYDLNLCERMWMSVRIVLPSAHLWLCGCGCLSASATLNWFRVTIKVKQIDHQTPKWHMVGVAIFWSRIFEFNCTNIF